MTKNKKILFIIWGLFISVSFIGLLILLLLSLEPKQSSQSFNQPVEDKSIQSSSQQEQEIYNNILKKIEAEVDKLTNEDKKSNTLKYPSQFIWNPDGTINQITEFNQDTGDYLKTTYYNPDGTIKEVKNY